MSFSYILSTAVGQLRAELGDTSSVAGEGVKPDGSYLTDEELQYLLDREGDDVMLATAAACELLARHCSRLVSMTVGPRSESLSDMAKAWKDRAAELREQYGGPAGATTGNVAFSVGVARADGYAANASAGGEWFPFDW